MARQLQVPVVDDSDLDFAPASYFAARDLNLTLPSDIKGQARRELARSYAAEGKALPPELAAPELSAEARQAWGRIHPAMMGGEYLPSLRADEVEIARISLASTTCDQISVRARRVGKAIVYSIVDEYTGADGYDPRPRSSRLPLSLRRLIALLDGACDEGGAVLGHIAGGAGGNDLADGRGFVTVESDFYPELGRYYAARIAAWCDANEAASAADND